MDILKRLLRSAPRRPADDEAAVAVLRAVREFKLTDAEKEALETGLKKLHDMTVAAGLSVTAEYMADGLKKYVGAGHPGIPRWLALTFTVFVLGSGLNGSTPKVPDLFTAKNDGDIDNAPLYRAGFYLARAPRTEISENTPGFDEIVSDAIAAFDKAYEISRRVFALGAEPPTQQTNPAA